MVLWWSPFIQSRKCMSLKFRGEFCVMTMNNDATFEEELTCQFIIGMKHLTNFEPSTRKSPKFHFNRLLLTKVYNVWAKISVEKLCLVALNTDTIFEGKLTCAFKNDMRNYSKFSPEHVWKSKNSKFDGILLSKVETVWA